MFLYSKPHEIGELLPEGIEKGVECFKTFELPGPWTQLFSTAGIQAAVNGNFENTRHNEHTEGVNARFAGQINVDTAGQSKVPRIPQRNALADEVGDIGFITNKSRHPDPRFCQF